MPLMPKLKFDAPEIGDLFMGDFPDGLVLTVNVEFGQFTGAKIPVHYIDCLRTSPLISWGCSEDVAEFIHVVFLSIANKEIETYNMHLGVFNDFFVRYDENG